MPVDRREFENALNLVLGGQFSCLCGHAVESHIYYNQNTGLLECNSLECKCERTQLEALRVSMRARFNQTGTLGVNDDAVIEHLVLLAMLIEEWAHPELVVEGAG